MKEITEASAPVGLLLATAVKIRYEQTDRAQMIKKIIDLHLVITKYCFLSACLTGQLFALAFQLLKISDLLPIHTCISPYFVQPCPTVVLITV